RLETRLGAGADPAKITAEVRAIIAESYKAHRRVVFNGNGYSEEWHREAERRGLPRFRSAVDVIPEFASPAAVELFTRHSVFSREEIESRCVIYLEKYLKQVNIEAGVMVDMSRRSILPAAIASAEDFARAASAMASVGAASSVPELRARKVAELVAAASEDTERLEKALLAAQDIDEPLAQAKAYRESVVPRMETLRAKVDALEKQVAKERWPFPSYEELLFGL
ncbi:MAG TPA: glutamine synthetase type III, partial [Rectinemataceae bacterium]|nr:glutamine synthetase type III [Rectinemataceae bacterium]